MGTCLDFHRCDCKPVNYRLPFAGTSVKWASLYAGEVDLAITTDPLCDHCDDKHLSFSTCLPAVCRWRERQLPLPALLGLGLGKGRVPRACPLVVRVCNDTSSGGTRLPTALWFGEVEPNPPPRCVKPRMSCFALCKGPNAYTGLHSANHL